MRFSLMAMAPLLMMSRWGFIVMIVALVKSIRFFSWLVLFFRKKHMHFTIRRGHEGTSYSGNSSTYRVGCFGSTKTCINVPGGYSLGLDAKRSLLNRSVLPVRGSVDSASI